VREFPSVPSPILIWFLLVCPSATVVAQPPTTVTGVVLDGVTNTPVADAHVASGKRTTMTGPNGRFSIQVEPGVSELRFDAVGYLETVVPLPGTDIEVRLFPSGFAETVEVVSEISESEGVSSTPVTPDEVFQVPGSIDNIFRTLDTLAGVASTGDFSSRLAVRGGTPDQNLTVMDGVEVHNPYRLFGIASAFNPETVENFQLTAGGVRSGVWGPVVFASDRRQPSGSSRVPRIDRGQRDRCQRGPGRGCASGEGRYLAAQCAPYLLRPRGRPSAGPEFSVIRRLAGASWMGRRSGTPVHPDGPPEY